MMIGALTMSFSGQLMIEWPYWIYIGVLELSFGFACWVIALVLNLIKHKYTVEK